ncbi:MAG: DNA polymerase III subunit chi [Gammaproteobacteria bacterium]|nr:DNA polymerase III subunit chi [Gammaproteobacteria bacterium]
MTQIDFYILSSTTPYPFIYRLLEKVYRLRHRCYIQCSDNRLAEEIDAGLWSYRQDSFIPHRRQQGESSDLLTPITIGSNPERQEHDDLLLNLDGAVPPLFSRFRRVAEVITSAEEEKTEGRARYLYYRQRGYPLNSHTIKS